MISGIMLPPSDSRRARQLDADSQHSQCALGLWNVHQACMGDSVQQIALVNQNFEKIMV